LIILDILVLGLGTKSSLNLADPNSKEGDFSSRELTFRFSNYECNNPSEFVNLPYVYSGTKRDILYLTRPFNCGGATGELSDLNDAFTILMAPLVLVDIPLSFVADTVMLPKTIPKQRKEGNIIDPPYFRMGNIQREKGNNDKAREYYEKGFKILPKYYGTMSYYEIYPYLPDFDDILEFIAKYHEQRSEYDKTIFYFEQLVEMAVRYQQGPSGPIVARYQQLGKLYEKTGYHEKASVCYDNANQYIQKYKK